MLRIFFIFPNMLPECQFFEKFLTYIVNQEKGVMNNDTRTDSVSIIFKKNYVDIQNSIPPS